MAYKRRMRWTCLLPLLLFACRSAAPASPQPAPTSVVVKFLGAGTLPKGEYEGTSVGGLSAFFQEESGAFLALSDDKGEFAPARLYTLEITAVPSDGGWRVDARVTGVLTLTDPAGEPFKAHVMDPEGLARGIDGTIVISSEGITSRGVPPFIGVFDRTSGRMLRELPMPADFIADAAGEAQTRGVRENYGFEALGRCPNSPLIYAMTEGPLAQDGPWPVEQAGSRTRLLRYNLEEPDAAPAALTYPLEGKRPGDLVHGATSLLCLDPANLLVLERSWGMQTGFAVQLFHARVGTTPEVQKERVLDLGTVGVALDNLEGLALSEGGKLLWVMSDDNFRDDQVTQVLAFTLRMQ